MDMYYHLVARDTIGNDHYLGRISELELKREPDKTVDCADGDTMTGSEKLSLSCKMYEKVVNPINDLQSFLLIPASGGRADAGQMPNIMDAIKINMCRAEYLVEKISGDFEVYKLSAVKKYSVAQDPVEYYAKYYHDNLFIYGIYEREPGFGKLELKQGDEMVKGWSNDMLIVPNYYCFVEVPMGLAYELVANDSIVGSITYEMTGAIRVDIA